MCIVSLTVSTDQRIILLFCWLALQTLGLNVDKKLLCASACIEAQLCDLIIIAVVFHCCYYYYIIVAVVFWLVFLLFVSFGIILSLIKIFILIDATHQMMMMIMIFCHDRTNYSNITLVF